MFGLTAEELRTLRRLKRPAAVQDFLETLAYSHDKDQDRLRSPRRVLRDASAHCIEGALLAATALWLQGEPPLLMDLRATDQDLDHVVTLYRIHGKWGAISKTNYAVLRFRDPLYRTPHELAMSYFNEYYLDDGRKTMRDYSRPFDLRRLGEEWITREDDLWDVANALDASPHIPILTRSQLNRLRRVDPIERKAGLLEIWPEPKKKEEESS